MRIKLPILPGIAICAAALALSGCSPADSSRSSASDVIRWGADEIGGAPYMFRDPDDSNQYIGFEKEIADEIARRLDKESQFVQTQWDSIIPALNRNDFDFAISGIEITPERKQQISFTAPYYISTKQLVVRSNSNDISSLEDLRDRPIGTLLASTSEAYLRSKRFSEIHTYDDPQRPYDELAIGSVDAVLLDLPTAEFYARPNPDLKFIGEGIQPGQYAIAVRKDNAELLAEINRALGEMRDDGTLKTILEKWNLWNDTQETLK